MHEKGFFECLFFDMSFTDFVTIRVIRVLYILGIAVSAAITLWFMHHGLSAGLGQAVLSFMASPVVFVFCVLGARIWCEMIVAAFRIAENTGRLVEQGRQRSV